MVGQERTVLPLLAEREFGVTDHSVMFTFIVAFGVSKAITNYLAGALADRFGRKPVLVGGWVLALPVPLLLMWAPTWGWVVAANVLLGASQGLTWSLTVIMKIDLVGPHRRGTAMGFNEAAGYGALALAAWATGAIAESAGLRPAPFLLGLALAGVGTGLSLALVRETSGHVAAESADHPSGAGLGHARVFALVTWRDRSLAAVSRAGLANNLNEGMAWGLFPILFATGVRDLGTVGVLVAVAPAVWAVGQLVTGALSDRVGRKRLIVAGQLTQAVGLVVVAGGDSGAVWAAGSAILGAGTALAYPALLAAVGDLAHPVWRGGAVGVYRLWRDLGFAAGALLAGVLADRFSIAAAVLTVAALTAASGLDVASRMRETLAAEPRPQPVSS
ncbi:MAG: MFS transporter [Actinobacteria bacterium]|nr:MFS transporter [Actinomycetota bacterium]